MKDRPWLDFRLDRLRKLGGIRRETLPQATATWRETARLCSAGAGSAARAKRNAIRVTRGSSPQRTQRGRLHMLTGNRRKTQFGWTNTQKTYPPSSIPVKLDPRVSSFRRQFAERSIAKAWRSGILVRTIRGLTVVPIPSNARHGVSSKRLWHHADANMTFCLKLRGFLDS